MKRVAVVITARPSYSRIKSALSALMGRCELQIICAASAVVTRFGQVAAQIEQDGFPVTARISSVVEEDTLANSALSTGVLTMQLANVFERIRPDVVVTIADRHETIATAIAASYQHIPLCHIQGGEVTGSIDDKVRNAVTQLADIHCTATEQARTNVWRVSNRSDCVYVTGCPSIDLAAEAAALDKNNLGRERSGIVVLQHPVTDEARYAGDQMETTIRALASFEEPITYFWPGEDAAGSLMSKQLRLANVHPIRNLPGMDFLRLLLRSRVIVGNSSVAIRECSYLGVPAVNIGRRQEGRERGPNVVDVGHSMLEIRSAVEKQLAHGYYEPSTLYGDGHAGERIAQILTGHFRNRDRREDPVTGTPTWVRQSIA